MIRSDFEWGKLNCLIVSRGDWLSLERIFCFRISTIHFFCTNITAKSLLPKMWADLFYRQTWQKYPFQKRNRLFSRIVNLVIKGMHSFMATQNPIIQSFHYAKVIFNWSILLATPDSFKFTFDLPMHEFMESTSFLWALIVVSKKEIWEDVFCLVSVNC